MQSYVPPVKPPDNRKDEPSPFDDATTNKEFFKNWKPENRSRLGDFHEGHGYIRPILPFEGTTTTADTFKGKWGSIPKSYKPEIKPIANTGSQEFKTVTMDTYNTPAMLKTLTKSQKKELKEYLKAKKKLADINNSKMPQITNNINPISTNV